MTDRLPGSPGKYSAVVTGGELQKMQTGKPFAITLQLDDEPVREGTPYSKAAVLPDELAAKLCPETEDPAPKDAFRGLWEKKADGIRRKSGTVISIEDSAHTPIKSLRLFGKTIQDGTPTPENPVNLESAGDSGSIGVTVAGKNLLKSMRKPGYTTQSNGVTFTVQDDGTITAKGTPINTSEFCQCIFTQYVTDRFYLPAGTYTLSSGLSDKNGYFMVTLRDLFSSVDGKSFYVYNTPQTITLDTPKRIWSAVRVSRDVGNAAVNLVFKPQIEIDSVATAYESYQETQTLTASTPNGLPGIPVSSGGNYTDENGQAWICDEIDFARGVYVQNVIIITPNAVSVYGTNAGQLPFGYFSTESALIVGSKVLCSHLPPNDMPVYADNNTVVGAYINAEKALRFRISATNTADEIKAFIANNTVEFLCALANPIETPLSAEELEAYAVLHTNKPNTTVLNDAGADMEVAYYTPTTPVQMVHSPADAGKILSIDEHGCVVPAEQKDRIVEQGVSGIWTYRKWDSGIAECWSKYTATVDTSNAFGGSPVWDKFYRSHTSEIPLPVVFTEVPMFNVSVSGGTVVIFNGTTYVSNSMVNMIQLNSYVRTEDTSKSYSITYCVHAIGRWK